MNSENEFIEIVAEGAQEGWKTHGVLASVAIAQAILESAWGNSELAKNANNLFGIKGDHKGYAYFKDSWEVIDGKNKTVRSAFKWYKNVNESIEDHSKFFTSSDWRKDNYRDVIGETDYKKSAKALKNSGYATDPDYAKKLILIIESNELYKFDEKVASKPEEKEKGDKKMPKILLIAGHGYQSNGTFDPGATGEIRKGEYKYMVEDLFPAMKKYLPKEADVVFYIEKKVSNNGNLTDIVKQYKADQVIEFHFDAFHNANARKGHVIIHNDYAPDELDLRLRDAIKNMLGVRYTHKDHSGISGRSNLYNVNVARNNGITYRLLELGFGTNKSDANIMINQVDEYAKELVKAIWDVNEVSEVNTKPAKVPKKTIGDSYTVQSGDTLSAIAKEYGTTVEKLARYNELKDKDVINVGQDIEIPANVTLYTVQSGDTLSGIAKEFGTTVEALKRSNEIVDVDMINVGQEIKIMNSEAVKAVQLPKFLKGEVIRIKKSASIYATGETMPDRIKGNTDTIEQVREDKVLLKKLYSWVKKTDVEVP